MTDRARPRPTAPEAECPTSDLTAPPRPALKAGAVAVTVGSEINMIPTTTPRRGHRLGDPHFRYPAGQTVAEMKAWHERWNDEHDYHPELDRQIATVTRLRTGRGGADPALDDYDAYITRMAAEQPTCWCRLCGEGTVEL